MWATEYIKKLQNGETVTFRPRGDSMTGIVNNGQLCIVDPIDEDPQVGDVVLCKVNGKQYLHLVKAVHGNRFQIGNNKGGINGWIGRYCIYGRLVGTSA